MSIWCSYEAIGWEDECEVIYGDGRRAVEPGHFERGEVRAYAAGWSNHYPTADVEAPASVGVAHIPTWCVPGHENECDYADDPLGPWLRLDIDSPGAQSWWDPDPAKRPKPEPVHGSVVMDEDAARALRDDIDAWLRCKKVRPE